VSCLVFPCPVLTPELYWLVWYQKEVGWWEEEGRDLTLHSQVPATPCSRSYKPLSPQCLDSWNLVEHMG
jgi:hypothetical protein